jgi:ferredoxin
MKQKLGNCGGAGQCTFCAMDFVESQGWLERSDYEDKKLLKNPDARLACLNEIQGPATIRKAKR